MQFIEDLKKKGHLVAYVGDVVGTGSSRKSATNSVIWATGQDIPFVPNKRFGGVTLGGKIAPIFFNTQEDSGSLPIEVDVSALETGRMSFGRRDYDFARVVARVVEEATTARVLTMEYEEGLSPDEACAATHLAFDAADGVWQGTFDVPAGNWEYKAPVNDSWDENYGQAAVPADTSFSSVSAGWYHTCAALLDGAALQVRRTAADTRH